MARQNIICNTFRLNMDNPRHVRINSALSNLNPEVYRSKNQFLIEAIEFYMEHYGSEEYMDKKEESGTGNIRKKDMDAMEERITQAAVTEARKEVIKLLGGVIAGMRQISAAETLVSEKEPEPDNSYENDDVIASCAMGWMMKGEDDG